MKRRVHDKPRGSVSEIVGLLPSGSKYPIDPLSVLVDVPEDLVESVHRQGVYPDDLVNVSSRSLVRESVYQGGEEGRLTDSRRTWNNS